MKKRKVKKNKPTRSKIEGIKSISEVIDERVISPKRKKSKGALERHKLLFKKISGNDGKEISLGKAMREIGYTEEYANNPHKLKQTKSWKSLMETHLSDEKLSRVHSKLLEAKNIRQLNFNYKMKDGEIQDLIEREGYTFIGTKRFMTTAVVFFSTPDGLTIRSALDMGYKLKGKYEAERHDFKFSPYTKEQLIEMILEKVGK